MNYDRFINKLSAGRVHYSPRELTKLYAMAPPNTIFLATGMPNISTFPFKKMDVKISDDLSITLEGKKLEAALQYQATPGYLPLLAELKDIQTRIHGLDSKFWDSRDLLVTAGSLDALSKALDMCLEIGDPIIFQEPCYPCVTTGIRQYDPRLIAAVEDDEGICPKKLRIALEKEGTPQEVRGKTTGVPKLMYINPTGSNPTGKTLSTQRKKDIYKIACDYDLLILEDDPYYFLDFGGKQPVSFMSLDTQGRVIRFDSLSKVMSAGIRIGFVTAPKPLCQRIELHMQVSTMHASGLPQVLIHSLLTTWQTQGLNQHFKFVQNFYKNQRDKMIAVANKYLKGLAEWTIPTAGMFLWLRIFGVKDVRHMVQVEGLSRGVVFMSGHFYFLDEKADCPYVRASFSSATEEEMDVGFGKFAEIIKLEQAKHK